MQTRQRKKKESKTNLVRTRDGFSTPAVSLKLTGPHTASLIKYPGRQLQEAIISCLCRCKVASSSSRLFGTPSSFSLQPLLLLMATPGAFPSCSQKLKNWDSKLNRLFPAWVHEICPGQIITVAYMRHGCCIFQWFSVLPVETTLNIYFDKAHKLQVTDLDMLQSGNKKEKHPQWQRLDIWKVKGVPLCHILKYLHSWFAFNMKQNFVVCITIKLKKWLISRRPTGKGWTYSTDSKDAIIIPAQEQVQVHYCRY